MGLQRRLGSGLPCYASSLALQPRPPHSHSVGHVGQRQHLKGSKGPSHHETNSSYDMAATANFNAMLGTRFLHDCDTVTIQVRKHSRLQLMQVADHDRNFHLTPSLW